MFIILLIGLYTSRAILNILGVSDYGIYNVVGGVVAMMGFLTASLSGSTSRYVTFYIGKGDINDLKIIFGSLYYIHILLAILIFILGETVGLWFVSTQLNIPIGRENAAFWVYQCAIVSTVVSVLTIPYTSIIIAHEKMNVFALFSVVETVLKLIIVLLLPYIVLDRLITYSFLFLGVVLVIRIMYCLYSRRHFVESKERPLFNKNLFKEISIYATWTMTGHLAIMGATQGINIILNIFYGTIINAARGIAVQVQNIVMQFCYNFQMALNPQLTKSYAEGNITQMHKLLCVGSKFSFYLLMLLMLPLILETHQILKIWLGIVPEHAVWFVRLILCQNLMYALSNPLLIALQATGNIKKIKLIEGCMLLSVLPIAYIILKFTIVPPEVVFLIYLIVEIVTQIFRSYTILPIIKMNYIEYIENVLSPIFKVLITSILLPIILCLYLEPILSSFFIVCMSCIISLLLTAYFIGCNTNERKMISNKLYKVIYKIFR